jgi:hypothetical protein
VKYHCTIDLLFDWFGISCMTTDNFCFYLQNRLIQTSQTGGQWYSDTSPLSIPWVRTCFAKTDVSLWRIGFLANSSIVARLGGAGLTFGDALKSFSLSISIDNIKLAGRNLGRVFNSRCGRACLANSITLKIYTANLKVENL